MLRPVYGSVTPFPGVTRLNSLPAGQAVTLGTIDNLTARAMNYSITLSLTLAATGVHAAGRVEVFLLESVDNTIWGDGIAGNATGDQASKILTIRRLRSLRANVNGKVLPLVFDIVGQIAEQESPVLDLRPYLSLLILNDTGMALPASGHSASYQALNYEVVAV